MIQLPPPPFDDTLILDDIIRTRTSKETSNRMSAIRDQVSAAYVTYWDWPKLPMGLPLTTSKDFRDSYSNKASAMKEQEAKIYDHFRGILRSDECPYCMIDAVSTLDHSLPKECFPEFSVLSKNLVPACTRCNLLKNEVWRRADGRRAFLHPYFHDLGDKNFLQCSIDVDPLGIAAIRYHVTIAPDDELAAIYASQFKKLGLTERFRRRASTAWGRFMLNLRAWRQEGRVAPSGIGALVSEKFRDQERALGMRHWETALWRTASTLDNEHLERASR